MKEMKRLVIALLAGALGGRAQAIRPLLIDAIVLDAGGRPVTNLTPTDFEVTEAGSSRTVERVNRFDVLRHTSATLGTLPALELKPDQIHPGIVFVVDDLCGTKEMLSEARRQLRAAVDGILQSGGRAAILQTSGGTGRSRQFTTDGALLLSNIDAIQYTGGSLARTACSMAAWSTVTHVLTGLHEIEGRKAVVLLSGDLPAPSAGPMLSRLAAQAATAIYATSQSAPMLAESAGGEAGVSVATVLEREQSYYVLAFTGESGNEIRVSLRRPGMTLRTRSQSIRQSARSDFPAPPFDAGVAESAINTPFQGDGIGLRVSTLFSNQKDGSMVDVLLHLDLRDLGYVRDLKGRYRFGFEVHVAGITAAGQIAKPSASPYTIELSEEEYRRARDEGVFLTLPMRVSAPGTRQVRVVVADSHSGRTGSASAFVDVPDLSKGALAVSGILLEGSGATNEGPGIRIFQAGATMRFRYGVYNPGVDKEGRSQLETQTRLFARSEERFSGRVTPLHFPRDADPQRRQVRGTIVLDKALGPGRYILQVNVTDKLSEKPRSASQFIDFTIE